MSVREVLTPAKLKKLTFRLAAHLNRGKEHDLINANDEYGLVVCTTSVRPNYKIIRKDLYTADAKEEDRITANLLAEHYDEELDRFCDAYNARIAARLAAE
jgi:hypothetical protein